jgi:hypothetical protein
VTTAAAVTGVAGEAPPSWRRRLRWVALAFVPSSWMLGVTTYISQDVAAIPLLWVAPLALYLLSFIVVFARWPDRAHRAVLAILPPLVVVLVLSLQSETSLLGSVSASKALILLHLAGLLVASLACHGELARDRPPARYLTGFYLCLSAGGVLGGLFNALLAPAAFWGLAEYPLVLVAACLFLPAYRAAPPGWLARRLPPAYARVAGRAADVAAPALLVAAAAGLTVFFLRQTIQPAWLAGLRDALQHGLARLGAALGYTAAGTTAFVVFRLPVLGCLAFWRRPARFGLAVAGFLALGAAVDEATNPHLYQSRNFFGVLKLRAGSADGLPLRRLVHGRTVHGMQFLDPARRGEPLTYYHRTGPAGDVFRALEPREVGVVGLGAGSLAAYGEPGRRLTFYEIDPAVGAIAGNGEMFTFLADGAARSGAPPQIKLGDGRLLLEAEPDGRFDLLVLDAFSSDAIPVHLLTREAIELYLRKLKTADKESRGGVLAFHLSNRYLELEPVLGNLAARLGLAGRARRDDDVAGKPGKVASQWAVLARDEADLRALARKGSRWNPIATRASVGEWTDDFTNLLRVLR